MKPRSDAPLLSWHDAMLLWKQTEREYAVHIDYKTVTTECDHKRYRLTLLWEVRRLDGAKGYKRIHYRTMDYPSRQYRSFPAGIVYTVNHLAAWLEEEREREKAALSQLPLFSAAD